MKFYVNSSIFKVYRSLKCRYKKRISLTVDENTYLALEALSGKFQQKISTVSLNLIREALESQEDIHFSKIADHRLSQKQKRISYKKAWKQEYILSNIWNQSLQMISQDYQN